MTPLGGDDVHQHNHLWKRVYPIRLSYTILCLDLREHRDKRHGPYAVYQNGCCNYIYGFHGYPNDKAFVIPISPELYGIIRGPELRRGFCLFLIENAP